MRTKLLHVLPLLLFVFTLCACGAKEPKVLTVYYSHWGGTEILANMIHASVGGDIFMIEPVTPYPAEGTHAAVQKHVDEGYLLPLKKKVENMKSYDFIFIGTPNWFHTMALPVKTFLLENDLTGKKIVPFATYGGSAGDCLTDIVKMSPLSTPLEGFAASGDDVKNSGEAVRARVEEWLQTIRPEF